MDRIVRPSTWAWEAPGVRRGWECWEATARMRGTKVAGCKEFSSWRGERQAIDDSGSPSPGSSREAWAGQEGQPPAWRGLVGGTAWEAS